MWHRLSCWSALLWLSFSEVRCKWLNVTSLWCDSAGLVGEWFDVTTTPKDVSVRLEWLNVTRDHLYDKHFKSWIELKFSVSVRSDENGLMWLLRFDQVRKQGYKYENGLMWLRLQVFDVDGLGWPRWFWRGEWFDVTSFILIIVNYQLSIITEYLCYFLF